MKLSRGQYLMYNGQFMSFSQYYAYLRAQELAKGWK